MTHYSTILEEEEEEDLSSILETFPTIHYKRSKYNYGLWVFWSKDDEIDQGFQNNNNNSSSPYLATRRIIYDRIKDAFSMVKDYPDKMFICQFWAPVRTISGRRLLSTSGQPFAVKHPNKGLSKYRLRCVEYQYNIIDHDDDVNNINKPPDINEQYGDFNPMIISDSPTASAFLNRLPELVLFQNLKRNPLVDSALECELKNCYMLPICFPYQSTSCCIGVVECSTRWTYPENSIKMKRALEEVGLGVFQVQERIPYTIIDGLKPARDEIEGALKIVCELYGIDLAQVWIPFEDDNHVPFSSYLEDTRKKQMLSLKLTGYLLNTGSEEFEWLCDEYFGLCDMFPWGMGDEFVEKTLQDYKPRFCNDVSKLSADRLIRSLFCVVGSSRLAICLSSIHTGAFQYVFEFMRGRDSDDVIFLEALLLTLKKLLPNFKFASGLELGSELDVIDVENSTTSEIKFLKIFPGERLSPIPEALEDRRTKPVQVVTDYIAPLEMKYKTSPIPLSREVIEQQYGNTETEAAANLKELGDKLHATDVENSTKSENIFQENILFPVPEALERGKKPMVENYIAPYKTAPIRLSQEAIEHGIEPFGNISCLQIMSILCVQIRKN